MMFNNIKKIALFISSGIGNAVVLVPLLNKLKDAQNCHITLLLDSVFVSKEFLIFNNFSCDDIIELTKINKLNYIFTNMFGFDIIFLDYSSSSIKNLLLSRILSKNIIAFRKVKIPCLNIEYRKENQNIHAVILALQLYQKDFREYDFDISEFSIKPKKANQVDLIKYIDSIGKIPIVIQASSANMTALYKNWPLNYWIHFLNKISENYQDFYFVLLGDKYEMAIAEVLQNDLQCPFINLIGKTDHTEMCELLLNSKMYIGLDSGLMHLAVAYGIPTFSVFGASSFEFVGYEKFDNKNHKVVYNPIHCWPCHGFSKTNRSKVKKPSDCVDIECLLKLKPDKVFEEFIRFYEGLI
jgi:ADP-heptose:LPS heptosyltransferase